MHADRRPLVLCYHAVSDRWQHELALPRQTIERQVAGLLGRGYRPGTAADASARVERVLHVTFDDAFRSLLDVLPALERLGTPVTVFVCSDYARDGRPLDVPELARFAAELPSELATMDWELVRELAERGVEVGSHTRTHPHLTRLSGRELELELRDSRDEVEAELGRPCRFFAYPYGEEDARVRRAVRAAGYDAAFALESGERDLDAFGLPRVAVFRSHADRTIGRT
jgi:peptidoglycan/xylan/chitin deacetylase (PgdA/CDA1 family)